ncbi:MAG: class I SAM-dependent rRNA methyltransferase [Calditrichia bacterium]
MKTLENTSARAVLKRSRERSVKNRHPWIFSGAVARTEGKFEPGDIVPVYSSDGQFLAKGFINPRSQIYIRLFTFHEQPVTRQFLQNRIEQAFNFRKEIIPGNTNAYRLINAEGDLMPGLIVDLYHSGAVMQIYSAGMKRIEKIIQEILLKLLRPGFLVEKSEGDALSAEGLQPSNAVVFGDVPNRIQINENGVKFLVDIIGGQKTGFFLDQRDNRHLIGQLSRDKKVLNCFSYTGGFSVYAALQGAHTCSVESSGAAQALAAENFQLNEIDPLKHDFVVANVFKYLRESGEGFDIIILDPPAFVKHKSQQMRGSRAYKDLNRLAIKKVNDGGLVLSCSCSAFVNWDLFQKIIFSAGQEAGRNVQIIGRFAQPPDHPVSIFHPEGEYLKTFLLRVYD